MIHRLALVCASVLMMTGAALGASADSVQRSTFRLGWMDARANPKHSWLYVTGEFNNLVSVYDLDRFGFPQIGQIVDGVDSPNGITVDVVGTVYVSNAKAPSVTIYPAGATSPALTLSQGLTYPVATAVDARGNVYVANRGSTPDIVVYGPGQTAPSQIITSSLIVVPTELQFDDAGNLYISDNATAISVIPAGSQQPVTLGLQGLVYASGLALDTRTGNLFVSQAGGGPSLMYAAGRVAPRRTLKSGELADDLTIGTVSNRDILFIPNSTTDAVGLYDVNGRRMAAEVGTDVQGMCGVAVKQPGAAAVAWSPRFARPVDIDLRSRRP